MQYMGGKFRQRRAIADALRPYIDRDTTYVEPFLGGAWSAAYIAEKLKPANMILNDINKPLMLLWDRCLREGCDWLPSYPTREEYEDYKRRQPEDDPLTAFYGFGFSFGGCWYSSYIKPGTSHNGDQVKSIQRKVDQLKGVPVELHNSDYSDISIPSGAVVYCDPPYEGRTKAHHFDEFDYTKFWQWVRELSQRCVVVCSAFVAPEDFVTVYDWGDTVHRYTDGKNTSEYTDGTTEKLIRYEGGLW